MDGGHRHRAAGAKPARQHDLTRDRIVRGTKGAKPGRGRRRLPSGGRAFPDLRASSLGCPAIFGAAEPTRAYSRPDTRGTDDGNSPPPHRGNSTRSEPSMMTDS